jgi:hypothetical protein
MYYTSFDGDISTLNLHFYYQVLLGKISVYASDLKIDLHILTFSLVNHIKQTWHVPQLLLVRALLWRDVEVEY